MYYSYIIQTKTCSSVFYLVSLKSLSMRSSLEWKSSSCGHPIIWSGTVELIFPCTLSFSMYSIARLKYNLVLRTIEQLLAIERKADIINIWTTGWAVNLCMLSLYCSYNITKVVQQHLLSLYTHNGYWWMNSYHGQWHLNSTVHECSCVLFLQWKGFSGS